MGLSFAFWDMVFCNITATGSTVCGRQKHQDSLKRRQVGKVYYLKSNKSCKFGGGKQFVQWAAAIIPVNTAHHRESNGTNITDLDIPLCLLKTTTKIKIKISTMT